MRSLRKKVVPRFLVTSLLLFVAGGIAVGSSIRVSGFGFFGNNELNNTLDIIKGSDKGEALLAEDVEDALWILDDEVKSRGYPNPSFNIKLRTLGGKTLRTQWRDEFKPPLQEGEKYCRANIQIKKGRLEYFNKICVLGLPQCFTKNVQGLFYKTNFFILTKTDRFYTEDRLKDGIERIRRELNDLGYQEPEITVQDISKNKKCGVDVTIEVCPGPRYYVCKVIKNDFDGNTTETVDFQGQVYTNHWLRLYTKEVRNDYLREGYPDVEIKTEVLNDDVDDPEEEAVTIEMEIDRGEYVTLNGVQFKNTRGTKKSVLRRKSPLKPGQPLNVLDAQKFRDRLTRLRAFKAVDLTYEEVDPGLRNAIYTFDHKKKIVVSGFGGIGSYDIVRGGIDIDFNNVMGYTHQANIKALQSVKTTHIKAQYLIPEIYTENLSAFAHAEALRREDVSFDRREFKSSAGFRYVIPKYRLSVGLQYNYDILDVRNQDFDPSVGRKKADASSIEYFIQKNMLDSSISPEDGYKLYGTAEVASRHLGGDVDYQRVELGAAYHKPLGRGLFFHGRVEHGALTTFGSVRNNIPINKRYFLGGPSTIRGYPKGEASPKDSRGKTFGSVSYVLGNVELEQRLSEQFGILAFVDALGYASEIENYPFNHGLFSVGPGIIWRTIVGPLTLSYGYNLHRRSGDPVGAFNFSLSYPF